MSEYKAIYKCRLCGEEFEVCRTSCANAQMITCILGVEPNYRHDKLNLQGYRHMCHFCDDGSFGFADFMGYRKIHDKD